MELDFGTSQTKNRLAKTPEVESPKDKTCLFIIPFINYVRLSTSVESDHNKV